MCVCITCGASVICVGSFVSFLFVSVLFIVVVMERMSGMHLLNSAAVEELDRDARVLDRELDEARRGVLPVLPQHDVHAPFASVAQVQVDRTRYDKLPTYIQTKFSGVGDLTIQAFFSLMSDHFTKNQLKERGTDEQLVVCIKEGLEGPALELSQGTVWRSGNDLFQALRESFQNPVEIVEARALLRKLNANGRMQLKEVITDHRRLCKLGQVDAIECFDSFVSCLDEQTAGVLTLCNFDNMEVCYQKAVSVHAAHGRARAKQGKLCSVLDLKAGYHQTPLEGFQGTCFKCQQKGHKRSECPK